MGRNGGSCNDGNLFIELSSFVTLGPGRYKHRLKLALRQGEVKGKLFERDWDRMCRDAPKILALRA